MERHIPPQSIESEMSILGACLIDNNAIDRVSGLIGKEDLYREAHRKIYLAMLTLADCNEPCDFVTLTDLLNKQGELEEVGGAAYLLTLVDYVPTAENVGYYCKIVTEKSLERKLLAHAQEAISMVHDGKSAAEVVEKMESGFTLIVAPQKSEPVAAAELITESARRLKTRFASKGVLQGMSWGIEGLDKATTGIQRGDLIVIAGRPSMGKSALSGNILRSVCFNDLSGMLFSLEMARVDVTDRIIADYGDVKYHHLRTGRLTDAEWSKNARACDSIRRWKLFIDDTPGISLRLVKSKAKRLKRSSSGLDVLVIDYLQLMGVSSKDNRTQSLGEISRGLKQLARELDIAVILLSQLNRSVDSRPDKRPLMSDLRDSGEIEQDADVILFPYRPSAYCQKCRDRVDNDSHNLIEHQAQAEIIIEKQRNGVRNISIPVAWLGQYQRFEGYKQ